MKGTTISIRGLVFILIMGGFFTLMDSEHKHPLFIEYTTNVLSATVGMHLMYIVERFQNLKKSNNDDSNKMEK
jgi:hypothetical protein